MYRLIPLCLFLLVLPPVEAVQDKPEAAPEVKAYPTLAPGHHVGEIRAMVFTPDGKRLITGGEDKTIQVWDVETGKRVKLFRPPVGPGTEGRILTLAMHPAGNMIAVGANSLTIGPKQISNAGYLLRLDDGRMRRLTNAQGGTSGNGYGGAFTADGKQLTFSLSSTICQYTLPDDLWSNTDQPLKSERQQTKIDARKVIAYSPDGGRLYCGNSSENNPRDGFGFRILNAKTLEPQEGVATGPVLAGAWTADGEQLISTHVRTAEIALKIWTKDGQLVKQFTAQQVNGGEKVESLRLTHVSPLAGDTILLVGDRKNERVVVVFDVKAEKGRLVTAVPDSAGSGPVVAARNAAGTQVAISCDPNSRRVALVDVASGKVRFLPGPDELEFGKGWTTTGNSVVWTNSSGTTNGLNLRALERIPSLREELVSATTKRDGCEIENVPGKFVIARGGQSLTLKMGSSDRYTLPAAGPVEWVAVAGFSYKGVQVYPFKTGAVPLQLLPQDQRATSVISSPDGKYLFATWRDGLTRIYRPDQPMPLLTVFTEGPDWVAWTEEGFYAASPNGERLIGWTVNQGLNREANLFPAEQFRDTLYRPDVIQLLLDKGSVAEALKAANAMRKDVPKGAADPEKLLPPEVSLKVDTTKLPQAIVTVTAKAGCKEQPVKSLRLLVDGRPLPGGVGRMTYEVERSEVTEPFEVTLPPGKHRLSVLARSKDDTPAISTAVIVDSPLPEKDRPIVHHVAIGISKYADDKLKLKFAEKDALDLGSAIQKSCTGTLYQKVETTSLTNDKAKRDAVLKALDATRKIAKSTDLLILSFAGHGIRDDGEFYLLTHEADTTQLAKTAISGADLRAKLADYPCQILLMLDACHWGAFAPLAKFKPATDDAARALADVEMRVAVMCAAQGHEEAFEAKDNGHFTAAVIRALQRDPRAFFDLETGELSVYHLQAFVSQEVSKATEFKQNPYLKMPLAHPPVIVTKFPMK